MRRATGSINLQLGVVLFFATASNAWSEGWNLFHSLGLVNSVPELGGLDALAPVALVTVVGCLAYGARNTYRKMAARKPK